MGLFPRTLKPKWIVLLITFILFLFYIYHDATTTNATAQDDDASSTSLQTSSSSFSQLHLLKQPVGHSYNRLSTTHQNLLNSALAHIKLGYVANRTPHYSTPPLLILYSFHQQANSPLDQRLVDITNTYYFSMMQPGSAFAYDMTWPVKLEWFFQATPGYMVMNSDQASFYKEKIQPHEIQYQLSPLSGLSNKDFAQELKGKQILSTTHWPSTGFLEMAQNPTLKALRDKYRLNHLQQKSDWFWLVSRLLFSRGTDWLNQQLDAYKDIMGGKLEYSESFNSQDPNAYRVTPEFAAKQWLRIGLRISDSSTEEEITCLVNHINTNICSKATTAGSSGSCHVFISAPTRALLKLTRNVISKQKDKMAVHAVAEGFGFADLNQDSENSLDHSIFDTDEERLKRDYARVFMDWIILSRMDYLIGKNGDGFLKTAAWAAQVQTDLLSVESGCRITAMTDW
jgi:hypothetical protein